MSDESHENPAPGSPQPAGGNTFHQEVQHSPATARVPDQVGRGVFCTHAIVMQGGHEFVVDFIQSLAPPRRVVSRVVLPTSVVPLFVAALQDNLHKYQQAFGTSPRLQSPQPPPGSPPPQQPPIGEVYEQLKLPDEMLGGTYANTVIISHSQSEFCFDFICNCFPRSVVTSRVYLAAPHVTEVFDSLKRCLEQYRQKLFQQQQPPPPPPEPPDPSYGESQYDPENPDS
jgi:hypothetical protein